MRVSVKQTVSLMLALALVLPGAMIFFQPMTAYAGETSQYADNLEAQPVKVPDGQKAEDLVKNPAQPDIYTLRSDYIVSRYGEEVTNYQPYVATVGESATPEERQKVKQTVKLPEFTGYDNPKNGAGQPIKNFDIDYNKVVQAAKAGEHSGDADYGEAYKAQKKYEYTGGSGTITIKHLFQDINQMDKYGNKPGSAGEITTEQTGDFGSLVTIEPLEKAKIAGFIPEDSGNQILISQKSQTVFLRYNRNHFNAEFDTVDGTAVPDRALYYGQVIPKLNAADIPTKSGAKFAGWKPSVDLQGTRNGSVVTFKAGEPIQDASNNPIKDLDTKLIMPAQNVKFTAVWEERDKAKYTVLYWAEKSDHADNAKLRDKYDFIGTRVINNVDTGSSPDLSAETIENVEFPDLSAARLQKAWTNKSYFNKFFVYNADLTAKENAEAGNPSVVKSVSSTGKTVYNVYYDRQIYTLYFTKSLTKYNTFFPTIVRNGKTVGSPEKPYTFKARFNQRMVDQWPNDPLEVKGFSSGYNSFGWTLNIPNISRYVGSLKAFRDTPPYRLSADLFLDIEKVPEDAKYKIPIYGQPDKTGEPFDIALGIEQGNGVMPHHLDFWLQDFEGNFIPDYDLYQVKSDTQLDNYMPLTPPILGYTPLSATISSEKFKIDQLDEYNNAREAVKPFDNDKGKMRFHTNFQDGDSFSFNKNGYMKFMYTRNKYELKFNNNPDSPKADSAYTQKEKINIYYDYKLRDLDLDNPNNFFKLGLTDLLEHDASSNLIKDQLGNYKVKKPDGVPEHFEFKGWALDPNGTKMVRDGNETMPNHNMVLYAKWDEPDKNWKVIFDPNGGNLAPLDEQKLTKTQKTILEGHAEQQVEVTYPHKLANDGDKQQFTVLQRQKLVKPPTPTRDGYNFLGWEVLRYKKDADGTYTTKFDDSYSQTYGVPELYYFGNDIVSPIYLKAIWVKDNLEKVTVYHYFLDQQYHIDHSIMDNPKSRVIQNQRAGQYTTSSGSEQSDSWFLAPHAEIMKTTDTNLLKLYTEYNNRMQQTNNSYLQTLKVEPKTITVNGQATANPDYKHNVFRFFYTPFRTRVYKVNYIDERATAELDPAQTTADRQNVLNKYRILDQETVSSLARHYDARNYKPINGWVLTSKPQQQLFYDVNEDTNELVGINGTGSDEITFYYKDVRILEVPSTGTTPPGYVRVTFQADEGGSFGTDGAGNPIKELHYDVLKGIKSKQLPVPQQLIGTRDPNKHYVTPDADKSFDMWDTDPLTDTPLNDNTVFTAKFTVPTPGGNPGTPTPNPTTPGTPGTPTPNPTTPGTPGIPGGNPTGPVSPTPSPTSPSTPASPAAPSTPNQPGTPASPGIPGMPSAPASPSVPNQPNPQDKLNAFDTTVTGANSLLYLYAAVLFTATGGLMLRISRKRAQGYRA
ncbi:InlB B-repeat-containing protein [Mobiluncus sp.]|uniref:InlB B-repeat-containing protein n=1 Tax=Mobiluncus sp. TaxID=47293 RepID=UPI002A911D0D|nr:InlB B-repeat-containing protein [Mobiluncus sp.]MDY6077396.1 InlB B-repeat-containing protein [Mobiluncus sp.]